MHKKLTLACLALVAFAALAVAPASSSAASAKICETTANEECHAILVGSKIRTHLVPGTSSTLYTPAGNVICNQAVLTGTVTKNEEAVSEGTIETAEFTGSGEVTATGGKCTSPFGQVTATTNVGNGTPWCVKAIAGEAMEVKVRGGSCANAERSITFVFDLPGGVVCKYSREAAKTVIGNYTTDTSPENSDLVIHIPRSATNSNFTKEEGGFLCPNSGELEVSFTLETDASPATEPLYIK